MSLLFFFPIIKGAAQQKLNNEEVFILYISIILFFLVFLFSKIKSKDCPPARPLEPILIARS